MYTFGRKLISKCSSHHLFFEDHFFTQPFIHSSIYFFIHSFFHHFPFIHSTNVYEGPRYVHPRLGTGATEPQKSDTASHVWTPRHNISSWRETVKNNPQTKIYKTMLWSSQRTHFWILSILWIVFTVCTNESVPSSQSFWTLFPAHAQE